MQYSSFPFDWITIRDRPSDIRFRADVVCDDFRDWFNGDYFEFAGGKPWHPKDFYRNTKTGIIFNHEFPKGVPFAESFPPAKARYDRRIARFFRCIGESKRVLAVRLDRPDQEYPTSEDDCRYARRRLSEKFPGVRFDVLLLSCEPGLPYERRREVRVEDGIEHITFDYKSREPEAQTYTPDMAFLVRWFADRFQVRDYRTPEERAARHRRELEAKYAQYGATTAFGYWCRRRLKRLSDRIRSLGTAFAAVRRRKFDQIIPLGVNCDVAFRFFCSWGFVESSLFAWSRCDDLDHLVRILGDFDKLFAGEAELELRSRMWRCLNTGLYMHGRFRRAKSPSSPPPLEEAQRADLADLRGRVGHLREKFRQYVASGRSTLFVHRLRESDETAPDLAERLDRLERVLVGFGARNWTLLVICESKHLKRMPKGGHRVFRAVRKFNPGNRVTDKHDGDEVGWKTVFAEFAPATILPKRHAFKFEGGRG